ncbi:MAG: PAS domain S-box protein [Myxacorys chilensis ATA2-1-KO14]|jgi:PAS domain S-box-containing protein|nr:PAS domain S-box protein [Myxacorys chilensis ATA2-1-KO14]
MALNYAELATHVQALQAQLRSFEQTLSLPLEVHNSQLAQQLERLDQTVVSLSEQVSVINQSVHGDSSQAAVLAPPIHEEYWRALSVCLPVGLFTCDRQGQCIYLNRRGQDITGCTAEESLGDGWTRFIYAQDRDRVMADWLSDALAGHQHNSEFRVQPPQGELRWIHIHTAPILTDQGEFVGHTGTIEDITKQKLAEAQIRASLSEKEALLKEIHHRVKNNLQIISSLIYLQAQRIADPAARQIFEESQSRISSMALVHDSLYRSQNFARINLSEYIQTLTASLFNTYRIQPELVKLNVSVEKGVVVSLDRAIPCGLILNELMTNALKHGFTDEQQGEVRVTLTLSRPAGGLATAIDADSLEPDRDSRVCLIVENDGNCLPDTFELQTIQSMGLRLVNALVNQIQGEVEVEKTAKTRFKVTFNGA